MRPSYLDLPLPPLERRAPPPRLVYSTSAYDSRESVRLLDGVVVDWASMPGASEWYAGL